MFLLGAGVLATALMIGTGGSGGSTSVAEEKVSEGCTVRLEAFVMEVKLSSLYDEGSKCIEGGLGSVSLEQLQQCLQKEQTAQVSMAMSALAQTGEKFTVRDGERVNIAREKIMGDGRIVKDYQWAESRFEFEGFCENLDDDRVMVEYRLQQVKPERLFLKEQDEDIAEVKRSWSGKMVLKSGEPRIVAAGQNERLADFLVLHAEVDER